MYSPLFPNDNIRMHLSDAIQFISHAHTEQFDIIFADPPYGTRNLESLAEIILEHLNKKGKFILECEKGQETFMDAVATDYGKTRILSWEKL